MSPKSEKPADISTLLLHADHEYEDKAGNVAPSISVSSTFRAPHPVNGKPVGEPDEFAPDRHVYSRYTTNISTRVEKIIGALHGGHALTYSSGLAAAYACMTYVNPSRIAISGGYHGVHSILDIYKQMKPSLKIIDLDDPYQPGDLCWLETPLNPIGEARDIKHYADKIHAVGGKLVVDATFAPPPLQNPFKWGADIVHHSATKYFGGHSDILSGVLVTKSVEEWRTLWHNRTYMGNVMGSLESWLLLRSLRTLHLRVPRQSSTATGLAHWLDQISKTPLGKTYDGVPGGLVVKVHHASLQAAQGKFDPRHQLEGGYPATFAIIMKDPIQASQLPHSLKYFTPATSLGGVESLIEQRLTSDPGADPRLIRISVGVEHLEDLKNDLRQGFQALLKTKSKL